MGVFLNSGKVRDWKLAQP